MTKIYINGQLRDMTSAEETEHQEAHKNLIADKKIRLDALEVKENLKASAKAKLIAGQPLTAEEADTIVL